MTYIYNWRKSGKEIDAKGVSMYGRRCRIIARGKMQSALVRFEDNGQKEIVSFRALRKVKRGNE